MEEKKVIQIRDLSKMYKLYDKPSDRLKESLGLTKKKCYREHYALSHVSFDVHQGETVGIIGTNGSGKSTILKIITGVLNPTDGEVIVDGRISALLELGAGFNMEYSGLENVYLNGTMIGFSREEIDEKLDDILNFADIGEFIHQPVKTYSSGMKSRLGFSISLALDPDILIVDEALSVGDKGFAKKCLGRMKELRDESEKTILFISHSLPQVREFCRTGIWIDGGRLKEMGDIDTVCDHYSAYVEELNELPKKEKKKFLDDKMKERIIVEEKRSFWSRLRRKAGL